MINALLIGSPARHLRALEKKIGRSCPDISLRGSVEDLSAAGRYILARQADLLFIHLDLSIGTVEETLQQLSAFNCEFIVISKIREFAVEAIRHCTAGYLLLPIHDEDLGYAVQNAKKRITMRQELQRKQEVINHMMLQRPGRDLIGVPTMDGLDFVQAQSIIRCEAMQRCTRIVTQQKSNIVSSYNLGEYSRLLQPYGFFSPHKSHLINLRYIKKYKREGSVIMADGSSVPVSKRRKCLFLEAVTHL